MLPSLIVERGAIVWGDTSPIRMNIIIICIGKLKMIKMSLKIQFLPNISFLIAQFKGHEQTEPKLEADM
jgi:hypothetical protein